VNQIEEAFRKKGIKGSEEKPAQGAAKQGSQGAPRPAVRTAPGQAQTTSHAGSSAWLPEDYVAEAERNMRALGTEDNRNPGKYRFEITTSKIRNILSMISDIYNDELLSSESELSDTNKAKKKALQVRILYEAGREESVKKFILQTKLLDYLKRAGDDRKKFIEFAKYMEALVAYHLYLGGKD
jgi:CRISPR-associated protein Csm2